MNYENLKALVNAKVYENTEQGITGEGLNEVLQSVITSLGKGYQFVGVATPTTNPGTPDQKVFYIATEPGTYTNFGGKKVNKDNVAIFHYDSGWREELTGIASTAKISELSGYIKEEVTSAVDYSSIFQNKIINADGTVEDYTQATYYPRIFDLPVGTRKVEFTLEYAVTNTARAIASVPNGDVFDVLLAGSSEAVAGATFVLDIPDGASQIYIIGSNKAKAIKEENKIDLNSENIASIISSYPTELVPNYPSAQTNVTGRFTPWLGFSKVKDLDKDGFLKAVVFSGTLSFSHRFCARVSRKVRNEQGVIQSLTTIREFSFYLEANKNRAELSELMPFGKDCVLEVLYDFSIPNGFINYRASAATGEWIKFQDQAVVSGSMWDVNAEIVYFGTGASAEKKSIKILSVGNSYAEDAFAYVPFILKDCCPSIDLTFGILYYGGCSLQLHEQHFDTSGDTSYAYRKILPEETKWSTKSSGCSIQYALGDDDWDVIVFQQNGANAGTYSTFQPYLNSLIRKFKSILNKPVRFAWHLIEPYDYNLAESVTRFESYCVTAEKVLNETLCDILFPSGTGLQNARTIASLQSLGDGGNMMHTSQHAQEGIPCYALALPNALVIADLCGFGASGIYGDTNVPTQTWVTERAIPNQNGTSVGATSANCHLAQMAAIMAFKKPLQITNLTELGIIG
jgi:hypothetical protein